MRCKIHYLNEAKSRAESIDQGAISLFQEIRIEIPGYHFSIITREWFHLLCKFL